MEIVKSFFDATRCSRYSLPAGSKSRSCERPCAIGNPLVVVEKSRDWPQRHPQLRPPHDRPAPVAKAAPVRAPYDGFRAQKDHLLLSLFSPLHLRHQRPTPELRQPLPTCSGSWNRIAFPRRAKTRRGKKASIFSRGLGPRPPRPHSFPARIMGRANEFSRTPVFRRCREIRGPKGGG